MPSPAFCWTTFAAAITATPALDLKSRGVTFTTLTLERCSRPARIWWAPWVGDTLKIADATSAHVYMSSQVSPAMGLLKNAGLVVSKRFDISSNAGVAPVVHVLRTGRDRRPVQCNVPLRRPAGHAYVQVHERREPREHHDQAVVVLSAGRQELHGEQQAMKVPAADLERDRRRAGLRVRPGSTPGHHTTRYVARARADAKRRCILLFT